MPINVQNTQVGNHLVTREHLHGYNGGVLHEVCDNLAVEHLQRTIVTGIDKQGQTALVILDGANSLLVETHRLVWTGGEIEIVPQKSPVVGSDNQVVAARVDVEGRDPASTGLDDLHELQLLEVVAADHSLRGDEEQRAGGMEVCRLGETGEFAERNLGEMLAEGVDGHGTALSRWRNRGEMVASSVP